MPRRWLSSAFSFKVVESGESSSLGCREEGNAKAQGVGDKILQKFEDPNRVGTLEDSP